jgi:hypothetical protein
MPTAISLYPVLIFLFYSFVLGFGFAAGGWLWATLIGALRRKG